jgi:hypothetical protein
MERRKATTVGTILTRTELNDASDGRKPEGRFFLGDLEGGTACTAAKFSSRISAPAITTITSMVPSAIPSWAIFADALAAFRKQSWMKQEKVSSP